MLLFCYLNQKGRTSAQHMTEKIMNKEAQTIFLSANIPYRTIYVKKKTSLNVKIEQIKFV